MQRQCGVVCDVCMCRLPDTWLGPGSGTPASFNKLHHQPVYTYSAGKLSGTFDEVLVNYDSRGSKALIGVCVCVCPQHNSETNDPKVFKLGVETFGYPTIFMVLGQNCQRSRSQGHKLQNHNGRREFAPLSSAHCLDYQCYQPRNGTKTWNFINYGSWKSFSVHVQILLHFCVDLSDVAQRPLYLCTQLLICTLPPSNPRRKIVWTLEDKREDFQNCSVPCCVPQFYSVICTLIWAVLTGELGLLVWV